MQVAIGSQNPVKRLAAQSVLLDVFPDAQFTTCVAESGVGAQPWGDDETRQGAYNRAQNALHMAEADLGVGLEGGVVESQWGLMTNAWCAIIHRDGTLGIGGGSHVLLPARVAQRLYDGDELGVAMDVLTGDHNTKQKSGAIGILTNNLLTRQTAYEVIIKLALAPFRQPDYYEDST